MNAELDQLPEISDIEVSWVGAIELGEPNM